MRFSVGRKQGVSRLTVVIALLIVATGAVMGLIEIHLKPTLLAIAEAKTTSIATQVINNVINDRASLNIDAQNLVQVRVDSNGRVTLIQPNTMEFNRLAADTTIKVQNALQEITEEKIKEAQRIAMESVSPISDVRTTADYRRQLVGVYVKNAIQSLIYGGRHEKRN